MKKERKLKLFVIFVSLFLFLLLIGINFVSADMNLRISGSVNNYTSDLWLKVKTGASGGVDVYDLKAPTSPSDYSQFSSSVAGNSLSIDSWNSNPRTLNLTYHLSSAQTGEFTLSWDTNSIDSSLYVVKLKYFGSDLNYITQVGSDVDMKTSASYTTTLTGQDSIYIQVSVEDYVAPSGTTTTTEGSSGGGGGGGGAPSTIPIKGEDVFIGNRFMDVFVVLDSTRKRYINLFNQAEKPIFVSLDLGELGEKGILIVNPDDLSFEMPARASKTIEVTVISPNEIGDYKGKIILKGVARQEINVDVKVTEQELLFDAEISIPWGKNILGIGEDLPVHITLLPQIKNPRLDVKANYYIKDDSGNIIHEESKTFIVEGDFETDLSFLIGGKITKPGKYYVEMDLEYPWPNPIAVATSRYSFEVREESLVGGLSNIVGDYKFIFLLIGGGIIIIIVLIMVIRLKNKTIRRRLKIKR